MPAGRPTTFKPEMVELAREYLDGGYKDDEQVIPSMAGLALKLKVAKSTLYNWMEDEDHELLVTLKEVGLKQEIVLLNGGLSGSFNAAISKLALHNHGYSDKSDTTLNIKEIDLSQKSQTELEYYRAHGVFPATTSS